LGALHLSAIAICAAFCCLLTKALFVSAALRPIAIGALELHAVIFINASLGAKDAIIGSVTGARGAVSHLLCYGTLTLILNISFLSTDITWSEFFSAILHTSPVVTTDRTLIILNLIDIAIAIIFP
jgi:hypothetical protein